MECLVIFKQFGPRLGVFIAEVEYYLTVKKCVVLSHREMCPVSYRKKIANKSASGQNWA